MILTIDELTSYLKISKEKIYKMLSIKELPAFKVGAHWRFKKTEIDKWIDHHSVQYTQKNTIEGRYLGLVQ